LSAHDNTLAGAGSVINSGNITVTDGVNLADNKSTGSASRGAIYTNGGSVSLAATSGDAMLSGNITTGYGGAVYASTAITVGNTGGVTKLENNWSGYNPDGTVFDTSGSNSGGGAIRGNSGAVTVSGRTVTLSGNRAAGLGTTGGGGAIGTGATVTINGELIADRNLAYQGYGGAISAFGTGDVTATLGVTLTNNVAGRAGNNAGFGGAISVNDGDTFLATGSGDAILTGNIAARGGGAIQGASPSAARGNDAIGNAQGVGGSENNMAGYTLTDPNQPASPSNITAAFLVNGGAVGSTGALTLSGTTVTVSGNRAVQHGGAIQPERRHQCNRRRASDEQCRRLRYQSRRRRRDLCG
jgi:predicted outer membrane repeat protein